jgi:hypothetical protein
MADQVRDIIVTTPKSQIATAALEAEQAKEMAQRGQRTWYFRNMGRYLPNHFDIGSRLYYVEDGFVYGFGEINDYWYSEGMRDETTGRWFGVGFYIQMFADTWKWIAPIPYKGFQGWRYAPDEWRQLEVIGNWLGPKPMSEMVGA